MPALALIVLEKFGTKKERVGLGLSLSLLGVCLVITVFYTLTAAVLLEHLIPLC